MASSIRSVSIVGSGCMTASPPPFLTTIVLTGSDHDAIAIRARPPCWGTPMPPPDRWPPASRLPADARLGEGRHAVVAGGGGLEDWHGERGTRRLAQPHVH